MIISETQQPPLTSWIASWERGKDPWHKNAFPSGLKHAGTDGNRQNGWLGLDGYGNVVTFVADGAEVAQSSNPQCDECGVEIVAAISMSIVPTTNWICLECSGASIEDFI